MLDTIISAIRNRQVLSLTYDSLDRLVEPHAVGTSTAGNDVLRCYQTAGGHITPGHEWDMLTLAKVANLKVAGGICSGPRQGYKRGDKGMIHIYAEL